MEHVKCKKKANNIIIYEIKEVCNTSSFSIDNDRPFDYVFTKMGKNIKNKIRLKKSYDNNLNDLTQIIEEKKKKIYNNLLDFYNMKDYSKITDENNMSIYRILKFSANNMDEINYLYNHCRDIPFKYFDVIFDDKNYGKLIYNFPLVEEVMVEIYNIIVYYHKSIYKIFENTNLDRGALDSLYEKFVIYKMSPEKNINKINNLFNKFLISKEFSTEKFVPNKNEKYYKKNII